MYKMVFIIALILLTACSESSTPPPTATPIPAFVAGEEDLAYKSFATYYDENCWSFFEYNIGGGIATGFDESYQGRGVYVGDGMWRFRFQVTKTSESYTGGNVVREPLTPEAKTLLIRSLPDGSWEDPCPYAGHSSEREMLESLDEAKNYDPAP